MWFRTIGIQLLGAVALATSATAQTPPAPPAITRTVVAATKLPTVTDAPLHFRAVSITLAPGEKSGALAANGILYQISGSTEISVGRETRMLSAGEGLFLAAAPDLARNDHADERDSGLTAIRTVDGIRGYGGRWRWSTTGFG